MSKVTLNLKQIVNFSNGESVTIKRKSFDSSISKLALFQEAEKLIQTRGYKDDLWVSLTDEDGFTSAFAGV